MTTHIYVWGVIPDISIRTSSRLANHESKREGIKKQRERASFRLHETGFRRVQLYKSNPDSIVDLFKAGFLPVFEIR